MKKSAHFIFALLLTLCVTKSFAQYPHYFVYDNENGLPSNEVYSIVQDKKGFVWIGCDAGLFMFDGIRYTPFRSPTQNSNSITKLVVAENDQIYCLNFKNQLFHTAKNELKELKHPFQKITDIALDKDGTLYACHTTGVASLNTGSLQWEPVKLPAAHLNKLANNIVRNSRNELLFLTDAGLVKIDQGQLKQWSVSENEEAGNFIHAANATQSWIFHFTNNTYFTVENGIIRKNKSIGLANALTNKKITNAKFTADSTLWISTYKGVIKYNTKTDAVSIYYPDRSFSNVLHDREGNYWFATLQSGIIRVPNLNYLVWNNSDAGPNHDRLSHIAEDGGFIYFSSNNGQVGKLDRATGVLTTYQTGKDADIESFHYDSSNERLVLYSGQTIYALKNNSLKVINHKNLPIKDMYYRKDSCFLASSLGLFLQFGDQWTLLNDSWCREIIFDKNNTVFYVASNDGVFRYQKTGKKWILRDTLLTNIQVLSIGKSEETGKFYGLAFDGSIYSIVGNKAQKVTHIPEGFLPHTLACYRQKMYVASNKGVWIYDISTGRSEVLTQKAGLVSNNVQDLVLVDNDLWLATGKGLQRIPLSGHIAVPQALVYLQEYSNTELKLNYDDKLTLHPRAVAYSAGNGFKFAYKINHNDWVELPGSIERIELQNLPVGALRISIKVIDHLGRDSENKVVLNGYVKPPYWRTWWFVVIVGVFVVLLGVYIAQKVIANIRKREHQKSELLESQLKAIRAQMNPHFMYNTLNSIQDLILKNDIKSTNYYLSRFSLLMQQILNFSQEEKILLSEELEMLNNYLDLEKLRFGDDFSFQLDVAEGIDTHRTYIPSLIVQPFVENAMKHGLLHLKSEKKLWITFEQTDGELTVKIEDNGIGRKKSAAIKARSNFNHKSFAGEASNLRVALLNQSGKYRIQLKVDNRTEDAENPGTIVSIHIVTLDEPKKSDS